MLHSPTQRYNLMNDSYFENITTPPPYRPSLIVPSVPYTPPPYTPTLIAPPYLPNITTPLSPRPLENISDFFLNINEEDSILEIHRTVARMLDFDTVSEKMKPPVTQVVVPCNEDFECTICLNSSTCGGKLKCGHVFHENCIHQWFKVTNTCPNCRDC